MPRREMRSKRGSIPPKEGELTGMCNKPFIFLQAKFKDKGTALAEDQFTQMTKQMEMFKVNLEEFASNHKDDIRRDPAFRVQFQEMCASIGVDPLASSKGFWAEMLGVGDFYYELGVQIIEVCLATSHRNGGLIGIEELRDKVMKSRGKKSQEVSLDDLLRAIKKLKVLGNGFTVIPVGKTYMVQSVPGELTMDHTNLLQQAQQAQVVCLFGCLSMLSKVLGNGFMVIPVGKTYMVQSVPGELTMDHTNLLQQAQSTGHVTKSQLMKDLKWEEERASRALMFMVKEGLVWVDDQAPGEREYWFPSFFPDVAAAS
ncbi:hypothetical protein FSP39_017805 [Pinctada imbricata]|uniref:Vacuolar-sorting protein SNF8 n=1 Tax=Pinctada imbricata TaxID=66713 RepID=A0AA88YV09_PINIB|nr:hypothetical protein FSP39_017805 [Pinctada imbricata]